MARYIRNLEPNCQSYSYSYSSVPWLLPKSLHSSCTLARNSEIKQINISAGIENTNSQQTFACVSLRYRTLHPPQNLCRPLKTFPCVSLRYRKHCGGGGWMAILVVVCGKMCGKMCGKIEKFRIGTKICVVVDMDPVIMIVVTKRQKIEDKKKTITKKQQKTKKTTILKRLKRQKDKKDKKVKKEEKKELSCCILEQGGQRPPQF